MLIISTLYVQCVKLRSCQINQLDRKGGIIMSGLGNLFSNFR